MNKEVKDSWLSDLRSGKYEQGSSRLEKDGKFCCLGLLCLRAVDAGIVGRWIIDGDVWFGNRGSIASYEVLPPDVYRWAGLDDGNPDVSLTDHMSYSKPGRYHSLAELNDSGHYDFNAIADIIEREF